MSAFHPLCHLGSLGVTFGCREFLESSTQWTLQPLNGLVSLLLQISLKLELRKELWTLGCCNLFQALPFHKEQLEAWPADGGADVDDEQDMVLHPKCEKEEPA